MKNMKFAIKNMKCSIKTMKFSIKNMIFSVYDVCQNSSFVLFVTEFSYHMYRKTEADETLWVLSRDTHISVSYTHLTLPTN